MDTPLMLMLTLITWSRWNCQVSQLSVTIYPFVIISIWWEDWFYIFIKSYSIILLCMFGKEVLFFLSTPPQIYSLLVQLPALSSALTSFWSRLVHTGLTKMFGGRGPTIVIIPPISSILKNTRL